MTNPVSPSPTRSSRLSRGAFSSTLAALLLLCRQSLAQPSDLQPEAERASMEPRPVDGIQFKPGKGLSAASADGDFSLGITWRNQFRLTIEQARPIGPDPDATLGLEVRRSRLAVTGNAFDRQTKYEVQLDFAPSGVGTQASGTRTSPLLDAYVKFEQLRDLNLRIGQYRAPLMREQLIAVWKLELIDRSLLHSRFTVDRDIGLDVYSTELFGLEQLRYNLGIYTGEGRNSFEQQSFGLLYLARVEVLPLGDLDDTSQGDFARSSPRLALGAAYAYHSRAQRNLGVRGSIWTDQGTADYKLATADLLFKASGLTLFGAAAWRDGTRNPGDAMDDAGVPLDVEAPGNGWGFTAQAGYLIPTTSFDVAARYSQVRKIGSDDESELANESEAGAGVSYFFAQHSLKLQADAFRTWTESTGFEHGTDQARVQLQLAL